MHRYPLGQSANSSYSSFKGSLTLGVNPATILFRVGTPVKGGDNYYIEFSTSFNLS